MFLPSRFPQNIHSLSDDNEDVGDEFDQLVPDGVEEVDLAKINLEQRRREHKLLLSDVKVLGVTTDITDGTDSSPDKFDLWMVEGSKLTLVRSQTKSVCLRVKRKQILIINILTPLHLISIKTKKKITIKNLIEWKINNSKTMDFFGK